jgi:hypothetical protein
MRASAAAGQLSAAGTTGTKQQYGGCDPQEVKVSGGCGPHEVNVLRAPLAGCKSTAGVTHSKLRLVRVEPAGETDFLRGALEPHTRCHMQYRFTARIYIRTKFTVQPVAPSANFKITFVLVFRS